MSPDEQLLCAGFEDSRIQLWGLAPGARPDPVPVFGVSHLRLANDHPEDIEARIGYVTAQLVFGADAVEFVDILLYYFWTHFSKVKQCCVWVVLGWVTLMLLPY